MPAPDDVSILYRYENPHPPVALFNELHRVNCEKSFPYTYVISVMAAINAELITYPLDITKTRLQIQGEVASKSNQGKYRGMLATVHGIAREEGVLKLWKGMTASIYRHMIYSGVRIYSYDYMRGVLATKMENDIHVRLPIPLSTFCGVCSGCLAQWLASPPALVKILIQMEGKRRLMGEAPRVHSVVHGFKYIVSRAGIKGLWKGSIPNVQRAAVVNLADLTAYDAVKQIIVTKMDIPDCLTVHILASICAGFVAACVGTPADVIKTRTMNQPMDEKGRGLLYKGPVDCFHQTVSKEGFTALYKGFVPLWIRLAPFALTFWVSFEQIHSFLNASGY